MQSERQATKPMKHFRLLTMFIIGVFLLSIVLPKQVAFANDGNYWQLQMIGADKAHEEGHKGHGINIAVVDDVFGEGSHGDAVTQVVKHIAPSATVLQHEAYRAQTTEALELNLGEDGEFEIQLPYTIVEAASFEMIFDHGNDEQESTKLTIDTNQKVASSSGKFTDLEVIDNKKLKGKYKQGFYQVSFSFTAMTSDTLAEAIQEAIDAHAAIINISLGTLEKDNIIETKINAAVSNGVIVVASSGNDGQHANETHVYYPAAHEDVISVGAVGEDGEYLETSNYGQVKAPGQFTYGGYIFHGTSIAAPYVSGLTAIYMNQQNSSDVKSLVINNINDKGIVQYKGFEKETADKSALQAAIEVAEKYAVEDYTADSYEGLTIALANAKSVNNDEDVTQERVDDAEGTLQRAIDGLVEAEVEDSGKGEGEDSGASAEPGGSEEPSESEESDESEEPGKEEKPDTENGGKPTPSTPPSAVKVEVDNTTPTPIQPKQTIKIGDTGSTIVAPADLPEGVSIVIKKVKETDKIVKDATKLEAAGDIYTIELENYDRNKTDGTFTLTLNYNKDTEGTPAIYYYNEDTREWEKRDGTIDKATGTISLEVEHFSTYGVFVAAIEKGEPTSLESKGPKENPKGDLKEESKKDPNELTPIVPNLDYKKGITITPIDEDVDSDDKDGKRDKDKADEAVASNDAEKLPITTTSIYNFITVGLLLIFTGAIVAVVFRRKTV